MALPGVHDTSDEADRVLLDGLRTMSAQAKVGLMDTWSRDVRALAMAGVDQRHPDASPTDRLLHLGRALYGEAVVHRGVADALRQQRPR